MTEKILTSISHTPYISGNVKSSFDDINITVNISLTLTQPLDDIHVLRAFFVYKDMKYTSIGVMDMNYTRAYLLKTVPLPAPFPHGICIAKKNCNTDTIECVLSAYFDDIFDTSDIFSDKKEPLNTPVDNARNILDSIKNATATCDHGISKNNCISKIKSELISKESISKSIPHFKTLCKIYEFSPLVNLSALKYAMFDGRCAYSFYTFGYYLCAFEDNRLLIAFPQTEKTNPFYHIEEVSFSFCIDDITYYAVMIELTDEGQYFVLY